MDIQEYLNQEKLVRITRKYIVINKLFFGIGVFFLAILLSVIISLYLISKFKTIQQDDTVVKNQEKTLISKFNKSFLRDTDYSTDDIKVHIAQGEFINSGGILQSMNNLVTYKGFILPRYFLINKNTPQKDISYFQSGNYDIKEILQFIENFVFIKADLNQEVKYPNLSLPLDQNITQKFNLNCLTSNFLIYGKVCNNYVTNFLDVSFVYNLTTDIPGLLDVFLTINNKNKEQYLNNFCETIENYTKYSNNTDAKLEQIINNCNQNILDGFYLLQGFIDIQKQLVDGYINKHTYNNPVLNNYKLLSYQELIYNDFIKKDINLKRLSFYTDFLQEIIKKKRLEGFYADVTYLFNNYFILNSLKNIKHTDAQNKSDISDIIYNLTKINQGNEIIGIEGIEKKIQNEELKKLVKSENNYSFVQDNTLSSYDDNWTGKLNTSFGNIKNLSFLNIIDQKFEGGNIYITGYISIQPDTLYGYFKLFFDGSSIFVKQVSMANRKELNDFLNIALSSKNFTLPEFYEYLANYINLYSNVEVTDKLKLFCSNLEESIFMADVGECNDKKISVSKKDGTASIVYDFTLDNYQITDIQISDKLINDWFQNKIKNIKSDQLNLIDTISEIVLYQDKYFNPKNITRTGTNDTLIIIENVQKYLGIKVKDIANKNGKYAFEFNVKGIDFLCLYDIQNHVMGPIYFKDIRVNNLPYIIRNFFLPLNDENQNTINDFLFDPLSYIQKVSPKGYDKYMEEKNKN